MQTQLKWTINSKITEGWVHTLYLFSDSLLRETAESLELSLFGTQALTNIQDLQPNHTISAFKWACGIISSALRDTETV